MTDPDYRALCAELVELCTPVDSIPQLAERLQKLNALAERARALLAEPEAEGPTDEELETFLVDVACQNGDMYYADPRVLARAVLARWGRPTPQPVAVSERLPGPEDCDEQGRCWLGGHQIGSGTPTWLLGYPAWAERFPDVHRFWLPANALPLPAPEGGEVQP